jgi:hypothetical protein
VVGEDAEDFTIDDQLQIAHTFRVPVVARLTWQDPGTAKNAEESLVQVKPAEPVVIPIKRQVAVAHGRLTATAGQAARLPTMKLEFLDGESYEQWCARVNAGIGVERSGTKTSGDKELDLFNLLPRPLLTGVAWLVGQLNYYNLLPGAFIKDDPMHTSLFVANLGSLNMGAGYHHLYEYGTCPLFAMFGKVEEVPMVVDGQVVVRPRLPMRFSFDERIDDGLNCRYGIDRICAVLTDPEAHFGCVAKYGSDVFQMWPPRGCTGQLALPGGGA